MTEFIQAQIKKDELDKQTLKALNRKTMVSPTGFNFKNQPEYTLKNQSSNTKNQSSITANNTKNGYSFTHVAEMNAKNGQSNQKHRDVEIRQGQGNKENVKDNSNRSGSKIQQNCVIGQKREMKQQDKVKLKEKQQNQQNMQKQLADFQNCAYSNRKRDIANRSTSKSKGIQVSSKQKQGLQMRHKPTKSYYLQNSPSVLTPQIQNQKCHTLDQSIEQINSRKLRKLREIDTPMLRRGTSKNKEVKSNNLENLQKNKNDVKSPVKQCASLQTPQILCQVASKDGQYKIVSRFINSSELKQASDLENQINSKSKRLAIKQLEETESYKIRLQHKRSQSNLSAGSTGATSPRKYILDPSKISCRANGNVSAYAVNSNQGISRKYNQDRVSIILNITKNGVKASFFAIYDGHGGAKCCDYLTQNLHQMIINSNYFPFQPKQAIIQALREAQTNFIKQVKENFKQKKQIDRSGSCAIILLIVGDQCYIANVGDSRAVLSTCLGKPIYSLSRDHKPTDVGQQTRILKEGGKIYRTQMTKMKRDETERNVEQHKVYDSVIRTNRQQKQQNETTIGPLRVFPGKLSVTRTFGDIEAKDPKLGGIPNCVSSEPQICKYSLTGKQDFILLGCDGLFEKLDSEEAVNEIWKQIRKNRKSSIHEATGAATQSIVKLCMDRQGTDNITAILICLGSLGLEKQNKLGDYYSA